MKYKKQKAFTMAEVLITIGIIGIVAAMTLNIVNLKIYDKEKIVHWKKMYSIISQAFLKTIADGYSPCQDGEILSGGRIDRIGMCRNNNFDNAFIDIFTQNLNAEIIYDQKTKPCSSSEINYNYCGGGGPIHTLKNNGSIASYNYGQRTIKLNTGEQILMGSSHGGPFITVDLDGYANGRNTLGKDIFVMKVYYNNIKPMGADGTYNKDANGDICECSIRKGLESGPYYAGQDGIGEVASGVCCSAYYLNK